MADSARHRSGRSPPDTGEPLDPFSYVMAAQDHDIPALVAAALREGRASLAFQPIVMAKASSRIAFYEGFIRLSDSQGRGLAAAAFISSVEETVIGRDVDCMSLQLGLRMLQLHPTLRLAINMSARSVADGNWRQMLDRSLTESPEIGPRLILEISEGSAMLLPDVVIRFMAELQPKGVNFALDDFGAGLIAFRFLKDFLFDLVKIDKMFIQNVDQNPDNQVLVEALVNVAHQFEMFAVAEGVENRAEARHLTRMGVDCLQGYLFGRPKAHL